MEENRDDVAVTLSYNMLLGLFVSTTYYGVLPQIHTLHTSNQGQAGRVVKYNFYGKLSLHNQKAALLDY